jgi:hypothetical protein
LEFDFRRTQFELLDVRQEDRERPREEEQKTSDKQYYCGPVERDKVGPTHVHKGYCEHQQPR